MHPLRIITQLQAWRGCPAENFLAKRGGMIKKIGKLVLDEMPDGIVISTIDGIIIYWNKRAEIIFGYSEAEALQ